MDRWLEPGLILGRYFTKAASRMCHFDLRILYFILLFLNEIEDVDCEALNGVEFLERNELQNKNELGPQIL